MPNHVTNVLIITGLPEDVHKALAHLQGPDYDDGKPCYMDFNSIVPLPEDLKNTTEGGGFEFNTAKYLCGDLKRALNGKAIQTMFTSKEHILDHFSEYSLLDMTDDQWEHFKSVVNNIRKYKHASWYGWSISNWGTKWNAYDIHRDLTDVPNAELRACITWDTAWSPVLDTIIEPFMEMHPNLDYEYQWADEDTGYNCGTMILSRQGEHVLNQPESGSNEAYELSFQVSGGQEYYVKDDKGNYIYKEEDDD